MAGRRNVVRNSFAMGELSPRMLGRSDLRGTYQQGLRRLVNFLVDKTGSAKYRAGTQHARQIGAAGDHRLIPLKIAGNPALLHLTTTQARVYYAAAPTAGFDLLSAASAAVTISLTAPQLRDLQWVQRPFNAIVAEGWYHQDDEDYTSLTAAGNTDPRGITSDGTYTWIADITAGKLFAYDAVERTAVAAKNFELTRDGLPGGDAITNHDRPIGCWTNGEHMFVSFERIDDYIAAYRMGDMAYDEAANIDSLVGGDNTAIRSLEGDATYLYVADEDDARIYAYTLADGERAPAQYYNTLRAAGCTNPIGLWLSESHMFVLHRNGTDRQIFAFDRESKAHDPDVDVPTIVASNANPFDIIGSAEFFWVTDRVADKVFAYAQPSPQDPEAAVYLFHPDIEPILLQWDSNGNALAAPRTSNVIADPPVVGQQPAAGAFFEQRLVVAGGNKNPQSIAGSRTPDPDTGRPRYTDWLLTTETGSVIDEEFHSVQTVLATNAFAYTLFSEVAVRVRWMVSKDEVVVIGCDEAIYLARELAPDTPPIIRDHTVTGAGLVRPAVAPFGVCYASADRRRVYEIISQRELTAHLRCSVRGRSDRGADMDEDPGGAPVGAHRLRQGDDAGGEARKRSTRLVTAGLRRRHPGALDRARRRRRRGRYPVAGHRARLQRPPRGAARAHRPRPRRPRVPGLVAPGAHRPRPPQRRRGVDGGQGRHRCEPETGGGARDRRRRHRHHGPDRHRPRRDPVHRGPAAAADRRRRGRRGGGVQRRAAGEPRHPRRVPLLRREDRPDLRPAE